MTSPKVNDDTSLGINLKWLIQIIAIAGMAVWGYFGITSKISQLEIDVMRMKDSVAMNSDFRVKWPLGQLGALPDDAEQNMRLRFIEADVSILESHVDNLRIKSVKLEQGRDDLHDTAHPFIPHVGSPREKQSGGTR